MKLKIHNQITDISYTSCPTDHYPYYQLIDDKCFYFESSDLTHNEAQANCMEKLKNYGGGKLFEPKSTSESHKVADFAYFILGYYSWQETWLHIGVTDKAQEGIWAYESDGSNITFVPYWSDYSYGDPEYDNCVAVGAFKYDYYSNYYSGDWSVIWCFSKYMSICESLLNK